MRCPLQFGGVYGVADGATGAKVVVDDLGRQREDVLALVVADEGQLLQNDYDVVGAHARRVADFLDGYSRVDALEIRQYDARPVPVGAVKCIPKKSTCFRGETYEW